MDKKNKKYEKIIEDLRLKYEESLQTINAIRSGDVDAIVVQNGKEDRIYSLKDAQAPYRILLEKMNEGAITISTEGLIFYCNKQASNMLEITIEQVIGKNIDNFIKKSDHSQFLFFLKNLENKEGKIEVDLVRKSDVRGKDSYIPVLISGNFLIQDGIKYLILVITNLTEHKKLALILKSEWFSRIILEQAANIILVTDLYGNVLRTNMLAIEILAKQEKFLSPNWHVDMFLKNFRLVLSNKELNDQKIEPVNFSLLSPKNKIKNGSEIELFVGEIARNFLINYNILKDNNQKLGYSISLTEITELKRTEEKLIEGEEKYRSLFESMSQPFFLGKIIYDNKFKPIDFIYLEVNKAWQDAMGFPKSKIIGKRAYRVFPDLERSWLKIFVKVIVKSMPIAFRQFGSITGKWFNIVAYPQKNGCFAVILEDITHQKNQEEKILSLSKFPSEDPNPVLRVDKNLKIIYSNKPGKKILNSFGLTGPLVPKKLAESLNLSLIDKNNLVTMELKIGKSIYEFTIIPVKKSSYFNIYGRDITEIKRAEKIKNKILYDKILKLERKSIARELHDNVSQSLFASQLFSENVVQSYAKNPKGALKNLEIIRDLNCSALSGIRILLNNMMPEIITNTTLKDLIKELLDSIKSQSRIKTDMIFEADHEINNKIKNEVYYIAKESLSNVAKHSEANSVKVIIELDHNKLKMVISDNGKGFDRNNKFEKRKFGLNIMKERAKSIGASLKVSSAPDEGTIITLLKKN